MPSPRAAHELGLVAARDAIAAGALTAEDYAAALLRRCREHAALNAFSAIDADRLLADARAADRRRARGEPLGALHGVPLAFKDNIATAQLPTTGGTAALTGVAPRRDAAVVERLAAQGALVLGKNVMHELAMGWTSDNPHFGRVANPHAPHRLAGGSSGGSAAAVAALLAPAAIGTDTNGSIRIPAALCGVAGLRPSVGRYPTECVMPLSHTLDTVGPLARRAEDLVLLDAVMAGQPPAAPASGLHGVRLALAPAYFQSRLAPEVEQAFAAARARLRHAGCVLVEAELPELGELVRELAPALIRHESALVLRAWLAAHGNGVSLDELARRAGSDLGPALRASLEEADSATARTAYLEALRRREAVSTRMHRYFREHAVAALLHPVLRVTAPDATAERVSPAPDLPWPDGSRMSAREAFGQNVAPASLAALPSLVLQAPVPPGALPVGLAFDGAHGSDATLLGLAPLLEAALQDKH